MNALSFVAKAKPWSCHLMKKTRCPVRPDAAAQRTIKRRLARQLIIQGKMRRRALAYAFVTGTLALAGIALLLE